MGEYDAVWVFLISLVFVGFYIGVPCALGCFFKNCFLNCLPTNNFLTVFPSSFYRQHFHTKTSDKNHDD